MPITRTASYTSFPEFAEMVQQSSGKVSNGIHVVQKVFRVFTGNPFVPIIVNCIIRVLGHIHTVVLVIDFYYGIMYAVLLCVITDEILLYRKGIECLPTRGEINTPCF